MWEKHFDNRYDKSILISSKLKVISPISAAVVDFGACVSSSHEMARS
jgi:hypothetical protein